MGRGISQDVEFFRCGYRRLLDLYVDGEPHERILWAILKRLKVQSMHVYFTRQGIAEEIGIKPSGLSTVTRALAKMKARGIVKKVGATHWIVNPRLFWIGNTASCETAYAAFCVMKEVGDKDT